MVGYKLLDIDREKIVNDHHWRRLICLNCTYLVKEPISLSCGHVVCCSCLESICKEGNSSVVVCPADGQELLLRQPLYPDKRVERQVMSLAISCTLKCNNGAQCEWYGRIRELEMHLKDYHQKEESAAEAQAAVPGPSGASQGSSLQNLPGPNGEQTWHEVAQTLQCQQSMDHNDIEQLKQQFQFLFVAYNTEKCHREQLQDVVRTIEGKLQVLEQKQSVDRIDLTQLKQQLAALADAVVSGKRDHKQLQDEVRIVKGQVQELQNGDHLEQLTQRLATLTDSLTAETQHGEQLQEEVRATVDRVQVLEHQQPVDQNDTEELKQQLAVVADAFVVEKRAREGLQEEVRREDGKIQALEQELEAQKTRCASAQKECVTERCRGIEALNIESGLLQDDIGRLQSGHADIKRSQAVLEARVGRFEDDHPQAFNGQGL